MFKKENHVELSDGGTCIVSNANCPLTEKEAYDLGIVAKVDDEVEVPCCTCTGYLIKDMINTVCPHYYGYIKSKNGEFFDCRREKII